MVDFFRVHFGVVSRADGHCAAKRSAYQSCGRIMASDGTHFDFSRKAKEHVQTIMLVPEGAPKWAYEPESLWQQVSASEKRVDAQEARLVDFSMPRQIPKTLWEACVRYVYAPFHELGMIFQIDIHDTDASDGGRNVNVHGLATLRPLDDGGFSNRKDRSWNDLFRERGGRKVREMFAQRLSAFCQEHGVEYKGDASPNSKRGLPDAEPQLPRWNFEAFARTQILSESLAALHDHRRRRREWENSSAEEIEAASEVHKLEIRLRARSQRRIASSQVGQRPSSKRDRRAAILRTWHQGGWIDTETIPAITSVRFDDKRNFLWINLADGTALIDQGDAISLKGPVTWVAALETAAAAERHGWQSVHIQGDQAYKDAVASACMLRGIEVMNHTLSPKAQAAFDRLTEERREASTKPKDSRINSVASLGTASKPYHPTSVRVLSSHDIHLAFLKRTATPASPPIEPRNAEQYPRVLNP